MSQTTNSQATRRPLGELNTPAELPDVDQRVLALIAKIGGGVHVSEIAYHTKLEQTAITDALCELEERGLVTPWAWTLGPQAPR